MLTRVKAGLDSLHASGSRKGSKDGLWEAGAEEGPCFKIGLLEEGLREVSYDRTEDSMIDQPGLNAYFHTVKRSCPSDTVCSLRSCRVDLPMGASSL
jgi:hypothetical protein